MRFSTKVAHSRMFYPDHCNPIHHNVQWPLSQTCSLLLLNSPAPGQNGHHFADNIFNHIFLNENSRIFIQISLKFVPTGPIDNKSALLQVMAWRRPGDKPLSETMMVRLLMHICVTRPQWVNSSVPGQNGHHFSDNIFSGAFSLMKSFVSW